MTIHNEIQKIAGTVTKDGTYYELQSLVQRDVKTDEIIPHYDGETTWYRVAITSPMGMPLRHKEFGPDEAGAYKYLKNRR